MAIEKLNVPNKAILDALEYAQKSINFTYDRMGFRGDLLRRVKNIEKGIISEGAFQKWLTDNEINYDYRPTHFTETDKSDIIIKNNKIDMKNFYVDKAFNNYGLDELNKCSALVPVDQLNNTYRMKMTDIYTFFAVLGTETYRAHYKQKPLYTYIISRDSIFNNYYITHNELGNIEFYLKDTRSQFKFYICGQNLHAETEVEEMIVTNVPTKVKTKFYSLLYLNSLDKPTSDVLYRINDSIKGIANVGSWGDIMIYEPEVYFLGWLTKSEFKKKARILPRFGSCYQYGKTFTDNYEVTPLSELNSPKSFIEFAR